MTKRQLEELVINLQEQVRLDAVNIHNKLNEPERQPNETLYHYKERLKRKNIINGLDGDSFILM